MKIPVMKPKLATFEEVAPFLKRIDQSNIYSNHGPLVCELEEAYSKYLNVNKDLIVALANATQAIQGLVSISVNTDWIVPDYTFSATGLAVLNANRNLHICDVKLNDWKIDINLISEKHRSFGIIPVMPFGSHIDFDPYADFDDVIIDAAASLGAVPPTFSKMRNSWAVVYSLHATKVLGAGEGAIVVCGNRDQANLLRAWSNFGFSANRISEIQGTNAKMSEFNAAYGLASFAKLEEERDKWLDSQTVVANLADGRPWTTWVNLEPAFQPYWIGDFGNLMIRDVIEVALRKFGIESRRWWAEPLSQQPAFKTSQEISMFKNAKTLASAHLGLPMYPGLTHGDIQLIISVIDEALMRNNLDIGGRHVY